MLDSLHVSIASIKQKVGMTMLTLRLTATAHDARCIALAVDTNLQTSAS